MRRRLLCCALLQGLLLTFALAPNAAAAARANRSLPTRYRPRSHSPRLAAARHSGGAALAHARRKPIRLHSSQPQTTALIDPVPRGKFVFPAPLKGSHDSLIRQNVRSNEEGLARIQDDADLLNLRRERELVALPVTAALLVDERLPANRRYCRPWTAEFLSDFSRIHYRRFHRPLQVNSAVRTVEYQRRLELVNGNAAPAAGDDASPHLTGATIDIAKKGLSMNQVGWIRAYLAPLQAAGKIDVEEEFYQSCFHITVYRTYGRTPSPESFKSGAMSRAGESSALLAARIH
jgi:hypothetical protein